MKQKFHKPSPKSVIPAKAGIPFMFSPVPKDSGFRRNDEWSEE